MKNIAVLCLSVSGRRAGVTINRKSSCDDVFAAARSISHSTGRLFSTKPPAAGGAAGGFDGEISRLYKIIAENHRHPSGPWVTMVDKVHDYARANPEKKFRVLDLATGPGEPAETIARQFPDHATVVATDISPDQVAIAQEKCATLPNMSAQVADMSNLREDFDEASFDVVTCCYGFMFPSDIPQAVQESYRVLKPGGMLVATTWNRIGMMAKLRAIMTDVLDGQEPPPPPMNPLSLKEPGLFEGMLQEAGFVILDSSSSGSTGSSETYEYPMDMTNDPETQFKASMLLVKDKLDELDAWDKARVAYEKHKHDYGAYSTTKNGHWLILGNEYKLTVGHKPK